MSFAPQYFYGCSMFRVSIIMCLHGRIHTYLCMHPRIPSHGQLEFVCLYFVDDSGLGNRQASTLLLDSPLLTLIRNHTLAAGGKSRHFVSVKPYFRSRFVAALPTQDPCHVTYSWPCPVAFTNILGPRMRVRLGKGGIRLGL